MPKKIKRSIHIYKVRANSPRSLDIDQIYSQFIEKNLKNNLFEIDNEKYLLVFFKKDESLLAGAFIKVKDVAPILIEKSKSILDFFRIKSDQDPGEMSNFIWDFNNSIIVGEFNWDGVRYLSTKLPKYLSNLLTQEITMCPVPYEETYKSLFLKNKTIKRMKLKVPKPNAKIVEDVYGLDVKDIVKYTSEDDDLEIEISVMCRKNKGGLLKEPLIKVYNKLKKLTGQEEIDLSVQDNLGEKVNLLEDVLMKYKLEFDMDDKTKTINRDDFFNKTKRFWLDNKDTILAILQDA